ncbi:hypothetical protein FOA43_002165 [Brettanomyces nanus]|uniref:Association with the SNF1 complex (ASC) domain-containing protein n=1 Tax=Eeniella nana TaxID=13502 RepID=A0A875S4Y5_EENNA|nr:uncharacterized protein FOA43_002165 [Brettanomyces nanus]QPG74829.1 hypothetical protein FOA43_002165 [Brettanomyces nanus]
MNNAEISENSQFNGKSRTSGKVPRPSLAKRRQSDEFSQTFVEYVDTVDESDNEDDVSDNSFTNDDYVYDGASEDPCKHYAPATFFSDADDGSVESVYNKVPIGSDEDDVDDEGSTDTTDHADGAHVNREGILTHHHISSSYTTEIPEFYDPEKIVYPGLSPYEFSDEEFSKMNHFEFLRSLNLEEPPLLPPYLNSNLLDDSSSKDYKQYPYQYQSSNHVYINDQYSYQINNLNIMDKYAVINSSAPPKRPDINRSSSSQSSIKSIRNELLKNKEGHPKLKHVDYIEQVEKRHNLVPSHVMLNHLITSNLKLNKVMTGSCIHRYGGKFITQIVYFPVASQKE